ncbi:hypothetical protein MD484_g8668, partial [Candolleomyces efflorescens]
MPQTTLPAPPPDGQDKENAQPPSRFGTVRPESPLPVTGKRSGGPLDWPARKKPMVTDPLVHHGRHFGRTVYAFANVHALILAGLSAEEQDHDAPPESRVVRRDLRIYLKLLEMVPGLEEKLMNASSEEVVSIASMLQKGANSSRSDDTRSLRGAILEWIVPVQGEKLDPVLSRSSKLDRGFHHERTGLLLCPPTLDWSNKEVKTKLRNKEILPSGADWPRFLYLDEKFEKGDPWKGLFRSRILIQAFKYIFTSPSSTEDVPRATRSGNARIHGMTRVTPASLAYVATQVRFALCSSSVFSRTDRESDSETFYQTVLELLEDPEEEEEVKELLKFWDQRIFPAAAHAARIPPQNSALGIIKAKRAAKRAALNQQSVNNGRAPQE